ncbi:hypothetical protein B586_08415 [Mycobacterium haemophilum DSM 44634]|uniref:Uncharacterized protein n=1 Tax=Mycobacterium haemophilum TaxID=29311 RepID=A0A0I9TI38_9MYCO|nr:hypothetical protein B586_08415 [Mycobacterium haemophilum DSM 44634]KLO28163.1 hypothetical protein ABH39_14440 [Mycobacterium haemophilum]KLO37626.1 hypothetical protein ABH38_06460 [Mycobacterium haemophilum]KLO43292.1 hypothetical protein ABH37_08620 [Mycobacterium haemophilum]KLO48042.1 hypothetical protein ABH36_14980 [Mycobacterium haemophilum]
MILHERKRLLEVAIEEARSANPHIVVQACTSAMTAKDCLDLVRAIGSTFDISPPYVLDYLL